MNDLPQKIKKDILFNTGKAAVSVTPVFGGALSVIFENVFTAPVQKRRDEWLKALSETIQNLTVKVEHLTEESLSRNDRFISSSLHASQIAMRTHKKEKIKYLQNALANVAITENIIEDLEPFFLRLIDELTPLHIRMLDFQCNLDKYQEGEKKQSKSRNTSDNISIIELWNYNNPEHPINSGPAVMVAKDLFNRGLSRFESIRNAKGKMTTKLGDEFLSYISEPSIFKKKPNLSG